MYRMPRQVLQHRKPLRGWPKFDLAESLPDCPNNIRHSLNID